MIIYNYPYPIDILFCNTTTADHCFSLDKIKQHAVNILKINKEVNSLLPEQLRPWCRVANIRNGVIILETANASWMMLLRYEQKKLLSSLRANILPSLPSIDIRINPILAVIKEKNNKICNLLYKKNFFLSNKSAIYIRDVAFRSEGKLKIILERLAELVEKSSKFSNTVI